MILKKLLPRALAAGLATLAVSSPTALRAADDAYNANDVLLFLQNPAGGVGNDQVVYYSLGGAVEVFRDAPAGTVTELGNIDSKLTEVFGADWTSKAATIFAGAAGQQGSTSPTNTSVSNGDYARTVYITKARTALGAVGQANSASPLFDPAQTGVAGQIAGSNLISGMTQPGAVAFADTLIEGYNPFSNGNPSTAYGAISGGIQSKLATAITFGDVENVVVMLDLYRVTKTTISNPYSSDLWHIENYRKPSFSSDAYPGNNGARADYLGTILLTSNGALSFVSQIPAQPVSNIDDGFSANDLLLFLQNPAGEVGNDQVIYYSLGSAVEIFRNSPYATVTELGNIDSKLTEVFGADWTSKAATIFAGAAGQQGSTSSTNTGVLNGDYARTVYFTKARTSVGTVGQANSASPLFDPAQTGVASQIAGSNLILGMTQPGSVAFGETLIDGYNPFSNGNPSTAYGAISGGIQNNIGNSTVTFGTVENVITALDLYRVTKTTGTNASSNSTWHIANFESPAFENNSYPGNNGARADFLGTLTLSNNGLVHFVSLISPVGQPPFINSATTVNGTVGTAFSHTITASNNPKSFSASGLPAGLAINSAGLISGTPTTSGITTANISATNFGGTGSASLTITIAAPPVITSSASVNGKVGAAFSYAITGSNSPQSFSVNGTLPTGLTLNSTSGVISGNPTNSGIFTVNIRATNSSGTGTKTLTIRIMPANPLITSASSTSARVGVSFSYTITATTVATSYSASGLPAGLVISGNKITGKPTKTGSFNVTVSASNSGGIGTKVVRITVSNPVPVITSSATAKGKLKSNFSYKIQVSNSPEKITVTSLPSGLKFNSKTNVISGKPTKAGKFTIKVTAKNKSGSASKNVVVTVTK